VTVRDPVLGDSVARLPFLARLSDGKGVVDIVPVGEVRRRPDGTSDVAGTGERFRATAEWLPLATRDPDDAQQGWEVRLEVGLAGDETVDAALDVAIRVPAVGHPDWLVPAIFYGENRPPASRARYPRWIETRAADPGDPFVATEWWFRADRTALPAVFATGGGRRVALATTETCAIGMTGVGFGTVDDGGTAEREVRLSFPYREAPVVYDGSADPLPADRPLHRWQPGRTVAVTIRVHLFDATRPAPTADATATVVRSIRSWLTPISPPTPRVDMRTAASLAADGLLRWHGRAVEGLLIETADFHRAGDGLGREPGDRWAMHVGWLSGAPAAESLIAHGLRTGRDDAVAMGRAVLDAIAANRAPCGTYWAQWTADGGWGKGWTPGDHAVHGRTLAEAALFATRAAAAAPDAGRAWLDAVATNLAWVRAHEHDGAVPTDWNALTGEPLSWAGTSALAWVPVAIEAAGPLRDADLRDVARRIGAHHAEDVDAGFLYGAPEDVDLGPTSEDGYVAIQAYVALAGTETDGVARRRWLDLARRAADWTLTFRYAYDVTFPRGSVLDRIGFRTRGADLASPANQHLHSYGLIVTGELLELSRMTGDDEYARQAAATLACFRQGIVREDGELGGRRGMAPERFYQTRYDGAKGSVGTLSHAWCLGLLLHAAELAIVRSELDDA
jgi:hypothetical protein